MGKNCKITTRDIGSEPYLIEMGDNVRITTGVKFFTHGGARIFREKYPDLDVFGKIKIGNNVYIGHSSIILQGVIIEDNVIVGAGSVVTKSVPRNCIVAGNPARIISTLEDYEKKLIKYNVKTKGLSFREKKDYLLNLSDEKFMTKPFMNAKPV